MNGILNIILILVILSIIVIVHEFGHFIFAKINGVTVEEFTLGLGPQLFKKKIAGTDFAIRLFPIGGACIMKGENAGDASEPDTFNAKTVWQRLSILFAGPVFNFILAFFLALIIVGVVGTDKPYVTDVEEGTGAYAAGLKEGDEITSINGKNVKVGRDLMNYLEIFNTLSEDDVELTVLRDGEEIKLSVATDPTTKYYMGIKYSATEDEAQITIMDGYPAEEAGLRDGDVITAINGSEIKSGIDLQNYFDNIGELGNSEISVTYERNGKSHTVNLTPIYSTNYTLGFNYNVVREKLGPAGVVRYSFTEVRYFITSTVDSLFYMFTGNMHSEDVGGVVRAVDSANDVIEESKDDGTKYVALNLIYWAILISANLGVMNLLPIPALDGGRILFCLIEIVRGKPIPPEKEAIVHVIGFILLMVLMVFLLFNDIKNVFF